MVYLDFKKAFRIRSFFLNFDPLVFQRHFGCGLNLTYLIVNSVWRSITACLNYFQSYVVSPKAVCMKSSTSTLDSQHLQEDLNCLNQWSSNSELLFGLSKVFLLSFKNTVNSQQHIPLVPLQSHALTPIKTLTLLYHLTYHGMITTSKLFLNRIKHSVY